MMIGDPDGMITQVIGDNVVMSGFALIDAVDPYGLGLLYVSGSIHSISTSLIFLLILVCCVLLQERLRGCHCA